MDITAGPLRSSSSFLAHATQAASACLQAYTSFSSYFTAAEASLWISQLVFSAAAALVSWLLLPKPPAPVKGHQSLQVYVSLQLRQAHGYRSWS